MYDLKFDTHTTYDFRMISDQTDIHSQLAPKRNETNSNSEIAFVAVAVVRWNPRHVKFNPFSSSFIKHAKERNKLFICINTIF